MVRVLATYPIHFSGQAISHIFLSLCPPALQVPLQIQGVIPSCDAAYDRSNLIKAVPDHFKWLAYRLHMSRQITEWRYLQEINRFDAAYIWPGISVDMIKKVKAQGKPIFLERINCFTGKAKLILNDAYSRLKVSYPDNIPAEMIQEEIEQTQLADFIFCPSPHVKSTFLEAGVPEEKLLPSSYGWSTERFPGLSDQPPQIKGGDRPFTIVFVGMVCVRKGAHLLMEAFVRSGVKGKLILCGQMEPVIAEVCRDWLNCPDIVHQPYTSNITDFYKNADVFAFPSLEEGGPLVTYEAMAHQLPVLVSPMGAGSIVRDGIDGLVLPPYDIESWADAIRDLAASPEMRFKFSSEGWKRATEFTFVKVANQRAQKMLQCL